MQRPCAVSGRENVINDSLAGPRVHGEHAVRHEARDTGKEQIIAGVENWHTPFGLFSGPNSAFSASLDSKDHSFISVEFRKTRSAVF